MFWVAYVFTVIVGGTFAVILRVLKRVLRSCAYATTCDQNAPSRPVELREGDRNVYQRGRA
jgi:hypothetical protein